MKKKQHKLPTESKLVDNEGTKEAFVRWKDWWNEEIYILSKPEMGRQPPFAVWIVASAEYSWRGEILGIHCHVIVFPRIKIPIWESREIITWENHGSKGNLDHLLSMTEVTNWDLGAKGVKGVVGAKDYGGAATGRSSTNSSSEGP